MEKGPEGLCPTKGRVRADFQREVLGYYGV